MATIRTNMPGRESRQAAKARNLANQYPGYVITTRYQNSRYAEPGLQITGR